MTAQIFFPKTNFFPHQPQILHQMVLQFFLLADRFAGVFPKEKMPRAIIMPYGGYFDTGLMQAAGHRYWLGFHKPKRVVVITYAELPEDISIIGGSYTSLHTFFGELTVDAKGYKVLKDITINNELFAKHADPIICQLPFLRSYQKIDSIIPLIINTKKTDLDLERFWSALRDEKNETCYILCSNFIEESEVPLLQSYKTIFSEQFLQFGPEYKTA